MKISIIVPTNNPIDYFKYFQESLEHLTDLLKYCEVEIYFIFQEPWTYNQIDLAKIGVEDYGFISNYCVEEAMAIPSMTYLRNLGVMACSKADYFMFLDDNTLFKNGTAKYPYSSGVRYSQALQYLEEYRDCGLVACVGSLGGSVQKLEISSTCSGLFATDHGLILRNIGAENIFRETTSLLGGLEESIACYHIIEEGYYPAKQFNNPTLPKNKAKKGEVKSPIHDREIWEENCQRYIQLRYYDFDWNHDKKRLPKGVKWKFLNNGGNREALRTRINKMNF